MVMDRHMTDDDCQDSYILFSLVNCLLFIAPISF